MVCPGLINSAECSNSLEPLTHQNAVTEYGENRLLMVKFDFETGGVAMDSAVRGEQGRPGLDLSNRAWPHGWTGTAQAHGVVFSGWPSGSARVRAAQVAGKVSQSA